MPHFVAAMNENHVSNVLFRYYLSQLCSSAHRWTHTLLETKPILKSTSWWKTSSDSSLDFPLSITQMLFLPHFSSILNGFVTACVSVICPWQKTYLWLYQGHSFLITDSFVHLPEEMSLSTSLSPPAWFFPDLCQIQQLKNCLVYRTDCRSPWVADHLCQTGTFLSVQCGFSREKHSWAFTCLADQIS